MSKRSKNTFPTAVRVAVKEANKSTYEQKVGAVILKRKSIISKGHNYSHRSAKKLHPRFQEWPGSIHAEVDCIIKARQKLIGTIMYVVRINNKGRLMNSRPCNYCFAYLEHVGIKKVYYSVSKYPYIAVENI